MGSPPLTRLLLVRHGESEATVKRIFGGELSCTGLTDLGRRQAVALRDRWVDATLPDISALYTSTLPRAIETAEILNEGLDLGLTSSADLVEHRPGEADGLPFADVGARYGPIDVNGRPDHPFAPGGESLVEFQARATGGLEFIAAAQAGKTVAIVCHGGVIDVAFRHFLDLPRRGHFELSTFNTSITEFVVDDSAPQRGQWRLVRYNDAAHLAGLPAETARD